VNNPIDKDEFNQLLGEAKTLLNVHDDQFDGSIRHTVVKKSLGMLARERGVQSLPLAVQRRTDNPEFVTWTGADTILGNAARDPRFALATETRVTKLISHPEDPKQIIAAVVRRLNTDADELVIAKVAFYSFTSRRGKTDFGDAASHLSSPVEQLAHLRFFGTPAFVLMHSVGISANNLWLFVRCVFHSDNDEYNVGLTLS
jgi:hypothetical protein